MTSASSLGHNAPPPDAAFSLEIDGLFSLLSDTLAGGEVSNDQQEGAIDALLDDFRKASADADKARKEEAKPFDDGKKAVQAKWKPIIDKAGRGVTACKAALLNYRVEKQRAKDEAASKAREEAEAREKAAQAALQTSADLEERFQAEQDLVAAKKLAATANRIDRSATGLRTHWDAEIIDRGAALRFYLNKFPEAFVELIQKLADQDARGARPRVPGILYHEVKTAV